MSLKDQLKRLQRQAEGPIVTIPLSGGGVALFRQRDLAGAYLISLRRVQGEDIDHPLCEAARNSSAAHWYEGIYAEPVREDPIEELFE